MSRFETENTVPATVPFTIDQRIGIFAKLKAEGETQLIKRADGEVR